MVKGYNLPAPATISSYPSGFIMPTMSVNSSILKTHDSTTTIRSTHVEENAEALEKKIAPEIVIHDTVLYMNILPSPDFKMTETKKEGIKKICEVKTFLKQQEEEK
eukprot:7352676-Ditylum_brightwellii.AAC.1